jgi:hypothetical protein
MQQLACCGAKVEGRRDKKGRFEIGAKQRNCSDVINSISQISTLDVCDDKTHFQECEYVCVQANIFHDHIHAVKNIRLLL